MKKERELQPGDIEIALSLKGNLSECAEFILENMHAGRALSDIKIKLIYYASFYELYFKYRLSEINPSLIWKDPTKYKQEKHVRAEFTSIDASTVLAYALNFKWVSDADAELIKETNGLRNKVIHFGLNEQDSEEYIRVERIERDFFDKNKKLVIKLLRPIISDFKEAFYLKTLIPKIID
ncbi:MAG: hypothetical protein HDT32_06760 [Clostridiales bacterium]|nr:hypothetical protein [Clostridiales bacterium]